MREDEKKFRTGCLLLVLIFIIIFITSLINYNRKIDDLNKNGRYTIGVTTEKIIGAKTNDYIKYYYYYKNTKYTGKGDLKLNAKVPNGKYFVVFSTINPYNSIIYFDQPVPDSVRSAPKEGWSFNDLRKNNWW